MAIDNSISNPFDPKNPLTIVTILNTIKLNFTNYLSWKTQIESIPIGYHLFKFIDGTHPCPPKTIITNNTTSINPAYQTWLRQDKLLFGALVGTISQKLVPLVLWCTTSAETWTVLVNIYAHPSRGNIKQIKDNLKNISKGSQTIIDYIQAIKIKADELATLGKPLDIDDLIEKVLEGLNDTFRPVINAVNSRDTAITFDELHEKLINRELALHKSSSSVSVTAYSTHTHRSNQRFHQSPTPSASQQYNRPMHLFWANVSGVELRGMLSLSAHSFANGFQMQLHLHIKSIHLHLVRIHHSNLKFM
ncbi:hypothetical protein PVK06_038917 [Gossypium arboreum]|uniref:Retrovirus-related Pol polyprotein from transposon RE1 n=1 Tax=Gossypium arboreum TaxID=29729 RepID=A0ABR0N448_GOSAR|nr:hypothetical protein PVK06_038917 [Gossypium arboreum]